MKLKDGAHLLTGAFDPAASTAEGRRQQLALLKRLARAFCRHGKYAVTILRNADGEDLAMFAVERQEDALRVSQTLSGRTVPPFGPWLSHRSFEIDAAAFRRMAVALTAPVSRSGRHTSRTGKRAAQ